VRVIGVIDLKAGRAVHARGGNREMYEPVRSVLLSAEQVGDAAALARAYAAVPGLTEIYVADLDSITEGAPLSPALAAVLAGGVPVMVDAGVADGGAAAAVLDAGAARVVIGLETLPSFGALERVVRAVGVERVVFSLDLRGSHAVARPGAALERLTPIQLADRAVSAGVRAVLLLDLARVGRATGPDLGLVAEVRSAYPGIEILVGGGIRGPADLEGLAAAGCDAVLLGTALHDGSLPTRSGPESPWSPPHGPQ
jgi:phosphoribosylformimino-5-aminoimidazole carboxamide ribotide isomerase